MFKFKVLKLFRERTLGPWVTATPPHRKPRPTFKPRLEPLEERWCPDTTNDVLYWNPQGGSKDASLASNWWDQTKLMQGLTAPGPTNSITLSGSKSNSPIEITQNMSATSVTVMNNYNNTLTVDAGDSLNLSGGGNILQGNILTFDSASSVGIKLTGGANFTVSAGATLNLKDTNTQNGSTYLSGDSTAGEYLNNQGTVKWYGTASAAMVDTIYVPVANSGTFNADGGSGGDVNLTGGQLQIRGSDAMTDNVSYSQSTSGTLNLSNNAQMSCEKGYYQSGGSITSDATPCALAGSLSTTGDINIAGGQVIVDNVANSVSTLTFRANTVEIDGEIEVNGLTSGGESTRCDQLICQGAAVTLGVESFLHVGTTGAGGLGTGNRWYVMTYASISKPWDNWSVPQGMNPPTTGSENVLVSN